MKKYVILVLLPILLSAESPKEILERSVRLFSHKNIRFLVHSTVERENGVQKRSFVVAKKNDARNSDLLIRFLAPSTLRCTTILTRKSGTMTQTYVYFPSLGRVRIIPKNKENKEAVGLGISYAELHDMSGTFLPIETIETETGELYKITKRKRPGCITVYLVEKNSKRLKKIETYENGRLKKEIVIDDIGNIGEEAMVLAWHIVDHDKKRILRFRVDKSTITSDISATLFKKNRLKRCSS
ncbi:outer membrane lipoprotein-sorting protein [Hydrogenimonas cancrithermarum]|uniref:Uncharacterized protein TP-0789 domain-containing protein n=1 Tax=Hydrogenimonas cancrithermarum TaxID=2993563 RepID=A0ABN6WWY4_9BACT|nr:outer membrane lipoprotein-sorting protein [Hydrogenimonas cancrithermarum]BDY13716.1 hypothetical protein HCR_20280 [Hydrogenimonas cancrithermarum]